MSKIEEIIEPNENKYESTEQEQTNMQPQESARMMPSANYLMEFQQPAREAKKWSKAWRDTNAPKNRIKNRIKVVSSTQLENEMRMYREHQRKELIQWNRNTKVLDGYVLMEASRVDLPHEVFTVRLNGYGLERVNPDDLHYFSNLVSLDVSDNALHLEELWVVNGLVNLNISCNSVSNVHLRPGMFSNLEVLDLSYNYLQSNDIAQLYYLKQLKELNLAYNNIEELNQDFYQLERLSTLSLEGNRLAPSDPVLKSNLFTLSKLSVLKNLNLSHNKIFRILLEEIYALVNAKIEGSESLIFNALADLDLSHNCISGIGDILELRYVKALSMLVLTGNPLLKNLPLDEIDAQINLYLAVSIITESTSRKYKQLFPVPINIAKYYESIDANTFNFNNYVSIGLNELGPIHSNEFPSKPNSQGYRKHQSAERERERRDQNALPASQQPPLYEDARRQLQQYEAKPEDTDTFKEVYIENSFNVFKVQCRKLLANSKDYNTSDCLPLNEAYNKLRGILKKPLNLTNHAQKNNWEKQTKSKKNKTILSKKMEKIKENSQQIQLSLKY